VYRLRILPIALRQPPIDRARSVSPYQSIFFRWPQAFVTLLTFSRRQQGYLADIWPACEARRTGQIRTRRMIMASGVDGQGQSQAMTQQATQDSIEQQKINAENKKEADAIKGFQQMLQELP
jgi:hypothetical protein